MQTRPCALGLRFLIYVKEAAASGFAKKAKKPVHEPDNSGTHTRACCLLEGGGLYAEKFFAF